MKKQQVRPKIPPKKKIIKKMPQVRRCLLVECKCTNMNCRLYNFPQNKDLKQLWWDLMEPHGFARDLTMHEITKCHRVCAHHFEEKYIRDGKRRHISCPTLFTPCEIQNKIPERKIELYLNGMEDHMYSRPVLYNSECEIAKVSLEEQHKIQCLWNVNLDHNYGIQPKIGVIMSGQESRARILSPPAPAGAAGNLLSSVAPPTQLPNFIATPAPVEAPQAAQQPLPLPAQVVPQIPQVTPQTPQVVPHSPQLAPAHMSLLLQPVQPVVTSDDEHFSPAIPISKGEPTIAIRSPEDSQASQSLESLPEIDSDMLGDVMPGSILLSWMKGAVSTGGILHRVAEKAKSSVNSMITTLDPQMKEYLKTGHDIVIVVATDDETKLSAIREAFQNMFTKASVIGYPAQSDVTAAQPVGYAAAYAAAKQRVAYVRSKHADLSMMNNVPVIAVEEFLAEGIADRWHEISLIVLSQPSLNIELHIQSQGTPVPSAAVAAASESTEQNYEHLQTGYSVTVGSIMADSLQVPLTNWQETSTGVSRREILGFAAKSLAGSYKRILAVAAAET